MGIGVVGLAARLGPVQAVLPPATGADLLRWAAGDLAMAPRATLISVAGLDVDDDGASVTLSGGDAQFATPVTVAVIG